jgi:hypothetical protein
MHILDPGVERWAHICHKSVKVLELLDKWRRWPVERANSSVMYNLSMVPTLETASSAFSPEAAEVLESEQYNVLSVTTAHTVCRWCLRPVEHAEGFVRYKGTEGIEFAHEAGFDAFMTGAVFSQLSVLLAADKVLQEEVCSPCHRLK